MPENLSSSLSNLKIQNDPVYISGFVSTQRIGKSVSFLTLREGLQTLQCVYSKDLKDYFLYTKITNESFVKIQGRPKSAKVNSCTIQHIEIQIDSIEIISHAHDLPFVLRDNEASFKQREEKNFPIVNFNKCLDNRSLDLRSKHSHSIFKIMDGAMFYFREFLRKNDFMEIKTSKLIGASSEGGANLFEVKYFKEKAYLAQSPQLYKQMALLGGFKKVYEIGHVYRAEESNINRYLSEFVGIDLEFEISENYEELYAFIYKMFIHVFKSIQRDFKNEIEIIREFMPFVDLKLCEEPLVLSFEKCVSMLKEIGIIVDGDFNRESEKTLGRLVFEKYDTDFFIIKDYPTEVRAFYTKVMENSKYSYSYDFILRGEEILSGAERENNYEELIKNVERVGIDKESIKGYLEAFKYGAPRHGGCGIGFERLMKAFFDFKDIRYFNMFPRDPTRLFP
ncbi:hypothetical protein GVAV_001211 [Gurleya vavrai]